MDTSQLRRPSSEYTNNEGFTISRRSSSPYQGRSRNSSRASSINYPIPDIKVHGPNDETDNNDFRKSSTSLEIDFHEGFHSYEDKPNASSLYNQPKQDEDHERPISPSIESLPDLETYMGISSSAVSSTSLPNSLPETAYSKNSGDNSQPRVDQERRASLLNSNNAHERSRRKSATDLAPFMQPRKSIVELTPAMQARISVFESFPDAQSNSQEDSIPGDINMVRRKSVMDEIPNLERRRSIRDEVLELEQRYMSRNEPPSPDASDEIQELKRRRSVRHEILSYERHRSTQEESNKRRKSRDEDEYSNSSVSNTSSDFDHDIVMRAEVSEPTYKKSIKKRVLDMVKRKSAADNTTEDMKEDETVILKQLLEAEDQKKDAPYLRYRKSITELEPYFQYQNEARRLSATVYNDIVINEYANKDSDMYKGNPEGRLSESEDSQAESKDLMTENKDDHDQDIKDETHSERRKSVALEVLEFIGRRLSIPSLTDDEKAFSDTPKTHLPDDDNRDISNGHSNRHSFSNEYQIVPQNPDITVKENEDEGDNGQRKQSLTKDVLGFLSRRLSNAIGTDEEQFLDKTIESFTSDDPESHEHKYNYDTGKLRRNSSSKEKKRESVGSRESEEITLREVAKPEIITSLVEPVPLEVAHDATKRSPRASVSSVNSEKSAYPVSQDNDHLDTEIIQYDQRRKSVSMDALDFMVRKFSSEPIPDHQSKNISSTYNQTFETENGTSDSEHYKKENDVQNENDDLNGELLGETRRQSLGMEVLGFIARRLSNSPDTQNPITPLVSGEEKRRSIGDNYQNSIDESSLVDDSHTFTRKSSSVETKDSPKGQLVLRENAEDNLENESETDENITLQSNDQDTRRKSLGIEILDFINRRLSNSYENENARMPHESDESQISPEIRRYSKSSTSSNRKLSAGSSENIQRVRSPSASNEERRGSRKESLTVHSGSNSRKQSRSSEDYPRDILLPETNEESQMTSILSEQYQQPRRKSSTKSQRDSVTDRDISRLARNRRLSHRESNSADDDGARSNRNSLLLDDKSMIQDNLLSYDEAHNIRRSSKNIDEKRSPRVSISEIDQKSNNELILVEQTQESDEGPLVNEEDLSKTANEIRRNSLGIEVLKFIARRLSSSQEDENSSMFPATAVENVESNDGQLPPNTEEISDNYILGESPPEYKAAYEDETETTTGSDKEGNRRKSIGMEVFDFIAKRLSSSLENEDSTMSLTATEDNIESDKTFPNNAKEIYGKMSLSGESLSEEPLLTADEDTEINNDVQEIRRKSLGMEVLDFVARRFSNSLENEHINSPSQLNENIIKSTEDIPKRSSSSLEVTSEDHLANWTENKTTKQTQDAQDARRSSLGMDVLGFIARRLSNSVENENNETLTENINEDILSADELVPQNTPVVSKRISLSRESPSDKEIAHNYEDENNASNQDGLEARRKSLGMEILEFVGRRLSNTFENESSSTPHTTDDGNVQTLDESQISQGNRRRSKSSNSSIRKLSTGSLSQENSYRSRKASTSIENEENYRRDSQSSVKSHRSLSQNRSDRSRSPSLFVNESQSSRRGSTISADFQETMKQVMSQEGILRTQRGSAPNEESLRSQMASLSANDAPNSRKASKSSDDYMRDLLLLKADITSDISKHNEQYQRSHRKSLSRSSRDSLTEKELQRSRRESQSPERGPQSRRASSKSNQLSNEEHNFQNTLAVSRDHKGSRRESTSSKEDVISRKESTPSEYKEIPRRASKSESGQRSNRDSLLVENGHRINRQSLSPERGRISQRNSFSNEEENNQIIVSERSSKSPKRDSLSVDNSQRSRRGSRYSEKGQTSNRESMSFEDDNTSRRGSASYGEQKSRRNSSSHGEQRSRRSSKSNEEQRSRRSSASYEERRQSLQAVQKSHNKDFDSAEASEVKESQKSNRKSVLYDDSYTGPQDSMHSETKYMPSTDFLSVENYRRSPRGSITDGEVRLTRKGSVHSNREARSNRGSISSEDMNHGSVSIDELNNYRKNSVYTGWDESDNRYIVPESDTESSDMTYDKRTESDEVLKQYSKVELISYIKKSMLEEESEITDFGSDSDSGSELNFELPINDLESDNQSLDTIVNNFTSQYTKHKQEQKVIVDEESTNETEFTTDLYEALYGHIMTILTLPELGGETHEVTATFVPDVTLDSEDEDGECDEKSQNNKYLTGFISKGIIQMSSLTHLDKTEGWTTLDQQHEKLRKSPDSITAVTFCGCGFLGGYLVGAATYLQEHAPHLLQGKIAGSSVGSLIAACIVCGVPIEEVRRNILATSDIAQRYLLGPFNPFFPIEEPLLKNLLRIIPEDGHIKASGRLFLSLTRATTLTNEIVSEYSSRDELVRAILCCCFLPFISGFSVPSYNGRKYIDGGMSNNMPLKGPNTLAINAFAGDFDICPEDPDGDDRPFASGFNQSIKMTNNNITRLVHSLLPPPPEKLDKHFEYGYNDARNYLHPNIQNRAKTL